MEAESKNISGISKPNRLCKAGKIDYETIDGILETKRLVIYTGKNVSRYQCEEELLGLCEILRAP